MERNYELRAKELLVKYNLIIEGNNKKTNKIRKKRVRKL